MWVREGPVEKVTFNLIYDLMKELSFVKSLGQRRKEESIPGSEDSKCRGPEVGAGMMGSKQ